MVRSERNMSLKNPVTPPGIDPGSVRLVAQRLSINIQTKTFSRDFPQFLKSSSDTEIWLSYHPPSISVHMNCLVIERLDSANMPQRNSLAHEMKDTN